MTEVRCSIEELARELLKRMEEEHISSFTMHRALETNREDVINELVLDVHSVRQIRPYPYRSLASRRGYSTEEDY